MNKLVYTVSFVLTLFFTTPFASGQALPDSLTTTLEMEAGSYFLMGSSGKDLPFWLHANRDGIVDQESANAVGYVSGNGSYQLRKNWNIMAGGELVARYSGQSSVFMNQIYTKLQGYNFILAVGRYIDPLALKEDPLSTGSFMFSRNASPIPKVALHTNGFVPVPGTSGILRYSGMFAHGWFENSRYLNDAYLHEKYFYLNAKYAFFDAVAGIVHNAQWAGIQPDGTALPSGWGTFKEVVFANGSSDPNAPGGEQSNAVGNSVAAYDFSLGLLFKKFNLRAYRLFYLEDKVSTRFRSPWDGIWGLKIEPKGSQLIQNILWEHINTKRMDSFDFEPWGTANYYNNGWYRSGWTYQRRVIGNPLLLTDGSKERPIYNNIIIAHHLGISGALSSQLQYTFKYTISRNYGVASDQIIQRLPSSECGSIPATTCAELRPLSEVKKMNHSILLEVVRTPVYNERLKYGVSIASDFGELYGDRVGVMARISYQLLSN